MSPLLRHLLPGCSVGEISTTVPHIELRPDRLVRINAFEEYLPLNSRYSVLRSARLFHPRGHGIGANLEQAMKMLWCWRCKAEVPMLDDDELKHLSSLLQSGTEGGTWEAMFEPLRREYERITGIHETNLNTIFHHVLSIYGPPCANCGKPLRTPRAKMCGSCMGPVR
jgi:hypothetical protein